jgi:hypothetical protein
MKGDYASGVLTTIASAMIFVAVQKAIPAAFAQGDAAQEGDCTSVGQTKTCVLKEPWGTRTTHIDLRATETVGGKLQNITGVELVFEDVRANPLAPTIVIGRLMLSILPGSTPNSNVMI